MDVCLLFQLTIKLTEAEASSSVRWTMTNNNVVDKQEQETRNYIYTNIRRCPRKI